MTKEQFFEKINNSETLDSKSKQIFINFVEEITKQSFIASNFDKLDYLDDKIPNIDHGRMCSFNCKLWEIHDFTRYLCGSVEGDAVGNDIFGNLLEKE